MQQRPGEWYVRKHGMGKGRRCTWRKLHLCVDETSKAIVAVDLTTRGVHDSPHLPAVLDQVEGEVGQVSADKAYDSGTCYVAILTRGAVPTIFKALVREWLRVDSDGLVVYELKHPLTDGTTHVCTTWMYERRGRQEAGSGLFEPLAFLARLAALIRNSSARRRPLETEGLDPHLAIIVGNGDTPTV
jgi:hypothetical protein